MVMYWKIHQSLIHCLQKFRHYQVTTLTWEQNPCIDTTFQNCGLWVICDLVPFISCFPEIFEGCVCYIFAIMFYKSKWEYLWNKEKRFLLHFESSFRSWDNQILTFQIFKCHEVIKVPKHETQNSFYWITWEVITVW